MTFETGTKVRYEAKYDFLTGLNGVEGTVISSVGGPDGTTSITVTKGSVSGNHPHIVGTPQSFGTAALVAVEPQRVFCVGDRVKVNDPESTTHHGLEGVVAELVEYLGDTYVKANVDESCAAFKRVKEQNPELDGLGWYLTASTLELVKNEKLKEGGAISYAQVERGQRIRVSYEHKGVVHSREGIVGTSVKFKNHYGGADNWTINVLDVEAERYGGKGQRLNWGSDKQKETIALLENAPEADVVLERLLESKGGTVLKAFADKRVAVREPFSDRWFTPINERTYTSEELRAAAGDTIIFYVEEGN